MNTTNVADISRRQAASVAGFGMVILAVLAPIGYYGVLQKLIIPGDATATASQILASPGLLRAGIACLAINAVFDLVVGWALYVMLTPVNKSLSLLSAWFRLAYTTILVVALNEFVNVLQLTSGEGYLAVFETGQLQAQIMLSVEAFYSIWGLGFIFFGVHLVLLGYLVLRSSAFPNFLGVLLIIAAFGYLHDHFGEIIFPSYDVTVSEFTFVGELLLIFWVLRRGLKGFEETGASQTKHSSVARYSGRYGENS